MENEFDRNLRIVEFLDELEVWALKCGYSVNLDYRLSSDEGLSFFILIGSDGNDEEQKEESD